MQQALQQQQQLQQQQVSHQGQQQSQQLQQKPGQQQLQQDRNPDPIHLHSRCCSSSQQQQQQPLPCRALRWSHLCMIAYIYVIHVHDSSQQLQVHAQPQKRPPACMFMTTVLKCINLWAVPACPQSWNTHIHDSRIHVLSINCIPPHKTREDFLAQAPFSGTDSPDPYQSVCSQDQGKLCHPNAWTYPHEVSPCVLQEVSHVCRMLHSS